MANLKTSSAVINLFTDSVKPAYVDTDSNTVEVEATMNIPIKMTAVKNTDDPDYPEFFVIFDFRDLCDSVSEVSGKNINIQYSTMDESVNMMSFFLSEAGGGMS